MYDDPGRITAVLDRANRIAKRLAAEGLAMVHNQIAGRLGSPRHSETCSPAIRMGPPDLLAGTSSSRYRGHLPFGVDNRDPSPIRSTIGLTASLCSRPILHASCLPTARMCHPPGMVRGLVSQTRRAFRGRGSGGRLSSSRRRGRSRGGRSDSCCRSNSWLRSDSCCRSRARSPTAARPAPGLCYREPATSGD